MFITFVTSPKINGKNKFFAALEGSLRALGWPVSSISDIGMFSSTNDRICSRMAQRSFTIIIGPYSHLMEFLNTKYREEIPLLKAGISSPLQKF